MNADKSFRAQVILLVRTLPHVAIEKCFALKGGTAINLFFRDMPRLSVDIDLAYLPVAEREFSLREIDEALQRIRHRILSDLPVSQVHTSVLTGTSRVTKLVIRSGGVQIKVEVTPVLRGTVFPVEEREVTEKVESEFGYARMQVVSFPDLFAGKIVAALDRQHPRDLFDVRLLLAREGVSRDLFRAFLVYLISHDRAMAEILAPHRRDISDEFVRGFVGMTQEPLQLSELLEAREALIQTIASSFTAEDRRFLISVKSGTPEWDLLGIPEVEKLPAVRWKLMNVHKLDPERHAELLYRLREVLRNPPGLAH